MQRRVCGAMEINRDLLWDYSAEVTEDDEGFRRWYVARVLTRGGIEDVQALGLHAIRDYLPKIVLPRHVRDFWEWFFRLAEARGDPHRGSASRP